MEIRRKFTYWDHLRNLRIVCLDIKFQKPPNPHGEGDMVFEWIILFGHFTVISTTSSKPSFLVIKATLSNFNFKKVRLLEWRICAPVIEHAWVARQNYDIGITNIMRHFGLPGNMAISWWKKKYNKRNLLRGPHLRWLVLCGHVNPTHVASN